MLTTNLRWALFSAGQLSHNRHLHFSAVNSSAHQFSPLADSLLQYTIFLTGCAVWSLGFTPSTSCATCSSNAFFNGSFVFILGESSFLIAIFFLMRILPFRLFVYNFFIHPSLS